MMGSITNSLSRLPTRQLHLLFLAVFCLVGAFVWFVGLKQPVTMLRLLYVDKGHLKGGASDINSLQIQKDELTSKVTSLNEKVNQASLNISQDELMVKMISEVDRIATRHNVRLTSTVPGAIRSVLEFEEMPFNIEASGSYQSLIEWLREIENALPFLSIINFEIVPNEISSQLNIKVQVAVYRQLKAEQ